MRKGTRGTHAARPKPLAIYNSLTRRKEVVKPIRHKHIKMYACGLTVYDYAHIGNLRTYVLEDILRRALEFNGFKVTHVMNITDVGHLTSDADTGEDKMQVGAQRDRKTAWEIADHYTRVFLEDLKKLNVERPHIMPKATQHVKDMIRMIQRLERKGYTYVIDDGVYFDTSKSKGYGRLAKLQQVSLMPGARIEVNPQKRNPTDFALWKFSPEGVKRDMEWKSPWGLGFPGWHLECSAMSMKYLGESFDMHCGGVDHLPVHHPNEIAQSEAATGKRFVKYWIHCNHLIVDGKRMAKSLGNFYTLSDVIDRGYDPMSLRFFYLQGHYRSQANFTFPGLEAARNALRSTHEFLRRLRDHKDGSRNPRTIKLINEFRVDFIDSINDDLNAPEALATLFNFMGQMNRLMDEGGISASGARKALAAVLDLDRILGLDLKRAVKKQRLPAVVSELIAEREEARDRADYDRADAIRKRIREEFGVILEDTPEGVKWKKAA